MTDQAAPKPMSADAFGYQQKSAVAAADAAMALIARRLREAADEVDRYHARLAEAASLSHKAELLGWAGHSVVSNVLPNLRLDLLAKAQAELAALDYLQQYAGVAK